MNHNGEAGRQALLNMIYSKLKRYREANRDSITDGAGGGNRDTIFAYTRDRFFTVGSIVVKGQFVDGTTALHSFQWVVSCQIDGADHIEICADVMIFG